jgi:hypothetical protein
LARDKLMFGSVMDIRSITGQVVNGLGKHPERWLGWLGCALRKPLGLTGMRCGPCTGEEWEARLGRLG